MFTFCHIISTGFNIQTSKPITWCCHHHVLLWWCSLTNLWGKAARFRGLITVWLGRITLSKTTWIPYYRFLFTGIRVKGAECKCEPLIYIFICKTIWKTVYPFLSFCSCNVTYCRNVEKIRLWGIQRIIGSWFFDLLFVFYRVIFELLWRDYFKFVGVKYGNKIFQVKGKIRKCLICY